MAGFERGVRPIGLWSTLITLSKNSRPSSSSYGAGSVAAAVQMVRDRVVERVVDQRRLARAGHAGHADEQADRQVQRDVLEVVAGGAGKRQAALGVGLVALGRDAESADVPARYWPVSECGARRMSSGVPCATIWPPCSPAPGPMSTTWSAEQDRVFVVLDDDHAVAEVAQMLERRQQAVVVALVQADRRLVEHVHDAGQARADLRGEADPLRFAAGERLGGAVERQIVQADVVEELQPVDDFLDDLVGDRLPLAFELEAAEELSGLA